MAKDKQKKEEEKSDLVQNVALSFYKDNKDSIYTEDRASDPFVVSTGVMGLDTILGGGVQSGTLTRLLGPPTSGKSSESLLIIKNFIDSRIAAGKKARGVIFPTEYRLTQKLKRRSGVKFVTTPEEWINGTVLIIPTNIYEDIANFLWNIVKANEALDKEERENFIVMVDCMDNLIIKDDVPKQFGENRKVAGVAYMTKLLWSKFALPFGSGQHMFLAISQQSAAPKIDPYSKEPIRQGGSSGGYNIQYQASLVLDFSVRYEGDYILENPDAKYDERKNKKIGHLVKGYVRKSDNEKYDVKFEYAVKYGRTDGNSVWTEKDVLDLLLMWEFLARKKDEKTGKRSEKGSLFFESSLYTEIKKIDADVPESFRGMDASMEYLESQPKVVKVLVEKFKTTLG